jgi:uncharacterized LabA/DUF88 family protein
MNRKTHAAAIFVDYQDLYHHLRQEPGYPDERILNLMGALRTHLSTRNNTHTLRCTAFADFETIPDGQQYQKNLYLQGIRPEFVSTTAQKNTVDLQLCIEVVESLHHNPANLDTIVLVTGSHDYLPLVQHIQRHGFRVIMVAFRYNPAVSLLQASHENEFIDANALQNTPTRRPARKTYAGDSLKVPVTFKPPQDLPYDMDRIALEVIEVHFGHYKEIYLSPLLRKLSEELEETNGHEPKSLIGDLEEAGAVRLEKRRGIEHDYTVLIVNAEHPEVIAVRAEHSPAYESEYAEDDDYDESTWEEAEPQWNEIEFEDED